MAHDIAETVGIDAFTKIDIRCGRVERAEVFDTARKPAIKLWIDFGPDIGVKASSAQITAHYRPADLVNRQVAAIVNLAPRRIAGFNSEVLVLGFPDAEGGIVLIGPDSPVPNGAKLA